MDTLHRGARMHNRRTTAVLVALLGCAPLSAPAATTTSWTQYQGRADHNAVLTMPALRHPWRVVFNKKTNGGLAVANGMLYTDNFNHMLYAIRLHDGHTIWKSHADNVLMSTPVVSAGVVVVGSGTDGWLHHEDPTNNLWGRPQGDAVYGFSAATGKLLWKYKTVGEDMPSPAIYRNLVIFANGDMHVYALDVHTGHLRWRIAVQGVATMASATLDNDTVFLGLCTNFPYHCETRAIEATTGHTRWIASIGSSDASVTVANGMAFTNYLFDDRDRYDHGGNDVIVALSEASGRVLWTQSTPEGACTYLGSAEQTIAATVADGLLFQPIGCGAHLLALDVHTGEIRWQTQTSGPIKMSPIVFAGHVYVGDTAGVFYDLDEQNGQVLRAESFISPFTTSPAVMVGGGLIIANSNTIYALTPGMIPQQFSRVPVHAERKFAPRYIDGRRVQSP